MLAAATDVDDAVIDMMTDVDVPVIDPPPQASHPSDPAAPEQRSAIQ